jgi:phage-related protein
MGALSAIGNFFVAIGKAIAGFFVWLWGKLTGFFSTVAAFVKRNLVNIINVVVTILFPLAGIIMALVRLIIKHWDTIKAAFIAAAKAVVSGVKAAWEKLVEIAWAIWDRIVGIVRAVVDRIRAIWQGIVTFIAVLIAMVKLMVERIWNGIVAIVQAVIDKVKSIWEGIVNTVLGVVDAVKNIWNGLVEFISPFWDWLGEKAASVWEGIKNTVSNAVDFIRNIWDGFTSFFTGAWDKIKGAFTAVAEFLGFDGRDNKPEETGGTGGPGGNGGGGSGGQGSGMPGGRVPEPRPSLAGAAAMSAASPANNYSSSESVTQINVNSSITTAVPAGTPAEQETALRRQAHEAVQSEWNQVIQGARGMIPSPEGRRAL